VIIYNVDNGQKETRIQQSNEDSLTTVCWSPDGRKITCGGQRGNFYQCDSKGNVADSWDGIRVVCLQYRKDGRSILAADTHYRIRQYNFDDLTDSTVLQEDSGIMSFSLDDSDRYAVLNIANQGIHMWDVEDKCLVRKFVGVAQGQYTLYSCFGGIDHNFIASGSEDHRVYMYHVKREAPILVLSGHSRTVNCVSWNPQYPKVLVSEKSQNVRHWLKQIAFF
jgi:WD40 repeat protein